MKRLLPLLVCTWVLLSWGVSAHAYILPAEQILDFMTEQLGLSRSFEITQTAIVYDAGDEAGAREVDGVLYFQYPDRFRSEVNSPEIQEIQVVTSEGAIAVMNGKIVSETETPLDHFKDLLLYRKKNVFKERLAKLQIDLETVSLGRFKGKIAYVIGAKYPDESVPQIWVEKETFRPIRYLVRGQGPMDMNIEEVEYTDYTPLAKKRWYPGRILFFRNGQLTKMYVLKTFRVNSDLPDELFDIPHLKTLYEPVVSTGPSEPPKSELDEVKKTIRDFSRTFE